MEYAIHSDVWDGALNTIKNNATRVFLCTDAPTTYTEAGTTFALVGATISGTDFTLGAGVRCKSRRLVLAPQLAKTPTATGYARYGALCDHTNTKVLYVWPIASLVITSGTAVDIDGTSLTLGLEDMSS